MQVLERDQQGLLACQALDRIAPLAQHALARDAGGARQQQRLFGRLDGRRQLRQPAWRRPPEKRQHLGAPHAVGEPAGGLQQGHVRLAGAVLFDALPARDRDVAPRRDTGEEGAEQRRLADAGLADDEHHLALARQHAQQRRVERGELAFAPDRRFMGGGREGRDAAGRLGRPGHEEPIAASVQRGDEARLARVVAERVAQLLDAGGERRVADDAARPGLRRKARPCSGPCRPRRRGPAGAPPLRREAAGRGFVGVQLAGAQVQHVGADPASAVGGRQLVRSHVNPRTRRRLGGARRTLLLAICRGRAVQRTDSADGRLERPGDAGMRTVMNRWMTALRAAALFAALPAARPTWWSTGTTPRWPASPRPACRCWRPRTRWR